MSKRFKAKVFFHILDQAARIPFNTIKYHVKRNPIALGSYFVARFAPKLFSGKRLVRVGETQYPLVFTTQKPKSGRIWHL